MLAFSLSSTARVTSAHAQRSAPESPARSTIFQPVPSHSVQFVSAIRSLNYDQHFSRRYRRPGGRLHFRHASRPWRLHLILHLHSLDNNQSLSSVHLLAHLDKHANHPSGHRSGHRLTAFAHCRNLSPTHIARVKNVDAEHASVDRYFAIAQHQGGVAASVDQDRGSIWTRRRERKVPIDVLAVLASIAEAVAVKR